MIHTPLRPRALLGASLLLLGAAGGAAAQANGSASPALIASVDSIVESAMREAQIPGVSVAITRGGAPVLLKGYGFADLEQDVAARPETVYRIGSITKQFTSSAIMRLAEQGKLRLEDPISRHLGGLGAWGDSVTIHHLLNHTSGIRSYTALGPTWMEIMPLDRTPEQMLALFRDEPADFRPGEGYRYNNSGYFLLGMVIEKLTGESYAEHLEEQFYEPLGLGATVYCDESRLIENRAEGYVVEEGEIRNDPPISMTQPYAAGSLCSTVGDLTKWARALAHGQVVSPESYRKMTTRTRLADGTERGYGYGLSMGMLETAPFVQHGGGINGFISQLAYYPEADLAISVLTNSQSADPGEIEKRIARRVLGIPEKE